MVTIIYDKIKSIFHIFQSVLKKILQRALKLLFSWLRRKVPDNILTHVDYIRISIPKHPTNAPLIAKKILETLLVLKEIDSDLFSEWYETAYSKKRALEKKVLLNEASILKLVEKDWNKKFPDLGCYFSLWTGKKNDLHNSSISFSLGTTNPNKNIPNNLVLSFPFDQDLWIKPDDAKVITIVNQLARIWEVNKSKVEIV